jgi:bla regulator protein BlaR1
MANWSQSHFLQSLGWATLNSFWQMALLWSIYIGSTYVFKLPSYRKYQLSVLAIATGFVWFLVTFIFYYQSSAISSVAFFNQTINESNGLLNIFLLSASIAYLSLLIFPSYKLYKNWQFVQRIRKQAMKKADLNYRLFVQNIAAHLGIKKKVLVYLSDLVKSPMTIGYLKPIILLPIAALNNLSTQQVEAILLHELSHIRRYDYLVNLMISVINTILYFNPFVKQFMRTIEEERENCCDQLVLQFGYDKVSYAAALLSLEKISAHQQVLALGAAGKKYLLNRIEKIVGMEKKKGFSRHHVAGMLAAFFCIVVFNSVLIIKEKKTADYSFAYDNLANPFKFSSDYKSSEPHMPPASSRKGEWTAQKPAEARRETSRQIVEAPVQLTEVRASENPMFVNVALDEVDASLTPEEKEQVKTTVATTKKVLNTMQWNAVEDKIADAMTDCEKQKAREIYLTELDKTVDWKNIEQNMKAQYDNLDWSRINTNVASALTLIKLDSVQKTYTAILSQLDKATKLEPGQAAAVQVSPLPDQSVQEINLVKTELRQRIEVIKALKSPRKVVRL